MPSRKLSEVMKGHWPVRLAPDASVRQAACEMANHHIGTILVTEADGKLLGIFTERDLVNRVAAQGLDLDQTPVSQVMTQGVQVMSPDNTVLDAMHQMDRHGIRHLPVVEAGRVVGVVSMRDFLGTEMMVLEEEHKAEDFIAEHMR